MARHPTEALFIDAHAPPLRAACDHYAGQEKFIRKALALQATSTRTFDVTMDLEDGAAIGQEATLRETVVALLRSTENQRARAGVRVHDPTHEAFVDDVERVVTAAADVVHHLTIPKVASHDDVVRAVELVDRTTRSAGYDRLLPIHVLIETHGALQEVVPIAAHPRVSVLDFGLMDFVSSHHGAIDERAMRSPGQFEHPLLWRAKTNLVAAALAHGAVPSHNVTIEIDDPTRAGDDARRARAFGFLRMWSIHPSQIEPIVDALSPDEADAARAARVLIEAQRADWAPVRIDGTLYDRASYRLAWTVLSRARLAGATMPAAANAAFFSTEG